MSKITFAFSIGALTFALSLSPIAFDPHSLQIASNAAFARATPDGTPAAGHGQGRFGEPWKSGGRYGPGGRFDGAGGHGIGAGNGGGDGGDGF